MERLTEKDAYWFGEEFWVSAKEPDDEEIDAVYMKLAEYEDLEEQGLLVMFPCKVGDIVYRINPSVKEPVSPMKVSKVIFTKSHCGYSNIEIYAIDMEDSGHYAFYEREINKAVFLTRGEAEAALERMGMIL